MQNTAQTTPATASKSLFSDPKKYMHAAELCELFGVKPHTIWRMQRDGRLPKPIQFGQRQRLWLRSEIEQLFEDAIAARNAQSGGQRGA